MAVTDLSHYVRVYDGNLEVKLCQQMIESFNNLERFHQRNGREIRLGLAGSAWTELNVSRMSDPAFQAFFRRHLDRALETYNKDIGLEIGVPNSPRFADLILKRYQPGRDEQFQLHFDSVHDLANRYLVFLWYLNEVTEGGETRFPRLGLSVTPAVGRLLMFPPYWMYQHQGLPPLSGEKFILSTYLLF